MKSNCFYVFLVLCIWLQPTLSCEVGGCAVCEDESNYTCSNCNEGLELRDGVCYASDCYEPLCTKCREFYVCLACIEGFNFHHGNCYKQGQCAVYNCKDCKTNFKKCEACAEDLTLYKGKCYYYGECAVSSCAECSEDLGKCTECETDYELRDNKCFYVDEQMMKYLKINAAIAGGIISFGLILMLIGLLVMKNCNDNLKIRKLHPRGTGDRRAQYESPHQIPN